MRKRLSYRYNNLQATNKATFFKATYKAASPVARRKRRCNRQGNRQAPSKAASPAARRKRRYRRQGNSQAPSKAASPLERKRRCRRQGNRQAPNKVAPPIERKRRCSRQGNCQSNLQSGVTSLEKFNMLQEICVISSKKATKQPTEQPRKRPHISKESYVTADKVNGKAVDKASSSLQKSDEATERATDKAGAKAASSLERKRLLFAIEGDEATSKANRNSVVISGEKMTKQPTERQIMRQTKRRHNRRRGFLFLEKATK
jgi:hypothetical protein